MTHRTKAFLADGKGVATIEFVLIAPMMMLLLLASVSLFNAYHTYQVAEKATYLLSDLVSRETEPSKQFITNLKSFFNYMVPGADDTKLTRISSITRHAGGYEVDWSSPTGKLQPLTKTTIPLEDIPDIAQGDSVIVTESFIDYTFMNAMIPLPDRTLRSISVTRPRFVGTIGAPR